MPLYEKRIIELVTAYKVTEDLIVEAGDYVVVKDGRVTGMTAVEFEQEHNPIDGVPMPQVEYLPRPRTHAFHKEEPVKRGRKKKTSQWTRALEHKPIALEGDMPWMKNLNSHNHIILDVLFREEGLITMAELKSKMPRKIRNVHHREQINQLIGQQLVERVEHEGLDPRFKISVKGMDLIAQRDRLLAAAS